MSTLFRSVSKVASSVAEVSSAASDLAEASANATLTVARATFDVLSTTATAAEEAWRGVDLLNVELHRSAIRVTGRDCAALSDWAIAGGGGSIPVTVRADLAAVIASVTSSVTSIEQIGDHFSIHGHFHTYQVRARSLRDGSCAAAVIITNSTFVVEWMFALWEIVGFSPKSQSKLAIAQLWGCLQAMKPLPVNFLLIDDHTAKGLGAAATVAAAPRPPTPWAVIFLTVLWVFTMAFCTNWKNVFNAFKSCRSRYQRVESREKQLEPSVIASGRRSASPERDALLIDEGYVVQ